MWTMDGNPAALNPNHFTDVETTGGGKVQVRQSECLYCGQRWMNAVYPVASEGWRPVRPWNRATG
jgi:hypothetical protein